VIARLLPYIVSAFAMFAGYLFGDRQTGRCLADTETIKGAYATQYATAQAQASRYQADLIAYGNRLSGQLALEREQHAAEISTLKRSIQRVTTLYRPAPGAPARPLPECIVTAGAVRLWNAATGARTGTADTDAAPGGADPATDPADLTDSGVRLPDLLSHHADYAQRCRDIEAQLNRAIDYLQADPANLTGADHVPK
jgi:hypothetical protein